MEEKLDMMTDILIGKVNEALKSAVSKIINDVDIDDNEAVKQLADLIGIGKGDVYAIMDGDAALLDFATVARMCVALGVSLDICDDVEEPAKSTIEDRPNRHFGEFVPPFPPIFPPHHFKSGLSSEELARMTKDTLGDRYAFHKSGNNYTEPKETKEEVPVRQLKDPKFDTMPRERLVDIIRKHFWDDEIDVHNAMFSDLVAFLEDKDAKIRGFKKPKDDFIREPLNFEFERDKKEEDKHWCHMRERLKDNLNRKGRELFGDEFCD